MSSDRSSAAGFNRGIEADLQRYANALPSLVCIAANTILLDLGLGPRLKSVVHGVKCRDGHGYPPAISRPGIALSSLTTADIGDWTLGVNMAFPQFSRYRVNVFELLAAPHKQRANFGQWPRAINRPLADGRGLG